MALELQQKGTAFDSGETPLPRLLYVGDVPVESSYHGSALLYRLLQNYPRERLLVVEGNLPVSFIDRRLPGVRYATLQIGCGQLLHTRIAHWYSSWLTLTDHRRTKRVDRLCQGFQPGAVLSVTHGYLWTTAARFASKHGLPLHLICHDDWPRFANVLTVMKQRIDSTFGTVYRQATSRLCVSPFMRDAYHERYKADGAVLYPSRAIDCAIYQQPPHRLGKPSNGLTVAFAGTINGSGYVRALRSAASILEMLGGRLLIFGPLTTENAHRAGLDLPNVELRGLMTSDELMRRFRDEVDVLFVPMSFDAADRPNIAINFPSKLADYTAAGLPLLIYGPEYSSAVRWARENAGVSEIVDAENRDLLRGAIQRLAANPEHRLALGTRALEAGRRYFKYETAQNVFHQALLGHSSPAS